MLCTNVNLLANTVEHADSSCQLCILLHISVAFSSGSLAHLHASAHTAVLRYRLSKALGHRYDYSYLSEDIDERIDLCRDALVFLNDHTDRISPVPATAALGAALYIRYSLSSQPNDLQEGFEMLSLAVNSFPDEPNYLADLGELLIRRYYASGCFDDIHKSYVFLQRAFNLRIEHPARGRICQLLAAIAVLKDGHLGQHVDAPLGDLIILFKESLSWRPLGHHSHFEGWNGLGVAWQKKFQITGNVRDLNRAINYSQKACDMLNQRHPRAFRFPASLSILLRSRYEILGNVADFHLAMLHAQRALEIAPVDRRSSLHELLSSILIVAAEYFGDMDMLSQAISHAREALDSVKGYSRFNVLLTLGKILVINYTYLGDGEALSEGIHHLQHSMKGADEGTVCYTESALEASKALLEQYEMSPTVDSKSIPDPVPPQGD
jgi:hypothetical protein